MTPEAVSVVILTYNNAECVPQTFDSAVRQKYPIRQLILSDDGSARPYDDGMLAALERACPAQTEMLICRNERNMGTVAHMNSAAARCTGKYIKFLAAGDAFSDDGALARLATFACENDQPAVTSRAVVCSGDLRKQYYAFPEARWERLARNGDPFRTLCRKNWVSAAGTIFHRRFFDELGGFDGSYRLLEDWPAWLRLTREGYTLPYLPAVTCLYAAGGVSSKDMDAYGAGQLRADMLRCYEREIMPYRERMDKRTFREACYGYDLLRYSGKEIFKRHPIRSCGTALKRGAKWGLFKLGQTKGGPA